MTLRLAKIVALLTALGGTNAGGAAAPVSWPSFPADSTCTPQIVNGTLKLGTQASAAVSAQMKAIFDADQGDRQGNIDWAKVKPRDLAREKTVLDLLKAGKLVTGNELVGAAYVFQHGSCPNHFLPANALAGQAIKLGAPGAKWIYAATLDRWLLNTRKPQKFGGEPSTFIPISNAAGRFIQCIFIELPIDPKTTDAERKFYNYPTKAVIDKKNAVVLQKFQEQCKNVPKTSQKFYF